MDRMNRSLLIIRQLLVHIDRLQELLGEQWPEFSSRLRALTSTVERAEPTQIPPMTSQFVALALSGPAAELMRAILRHVQAEAAPEHFATRSASGEGATAESLPETKAKSNDLGRTEDSAPPLDRAAVVAALHDLIVAVGDRPHSVVHGADTGRAEPTSLSRVTLGEAAADDQAADAQAADAQAADAQAADAWAADAWAADAQAAAAQAEPDAKATEDQRDPPRSAYGLLRCPEAVTVGREFELVVGLAEQQEPGVAGGPIERPESSIGPYRLIIDVDADGFELRTGESWRNELQVTIDEPYPTLTLHLTAAMQDEEVRRTKIEATFAVDGQTIGLAVRFLTVRSVVDAVPGPALSAPASGVTMSIPSSETAPDLTIRIRTWASASGGRLRWSVESPHPVTLPETSEGDVGKEPREFARDLVRQMTMREGRPGMYAFLRGKGRAIARKIPLPVRDTLRAVAAQIAPRVPTCLILSQEPYIPWELAVIDPPFDASAPPFFGTQTVLGRWTLEDEPPPPPTPPTEVKARDMAVIYGVYEKVPGWRRLQQAEEEAEDLKAAYSAAGVEATMEAVLACLQGHPTADILHFAVHGKYDPGGVQRGLALVDGQMLDPAQVEADPLRRPALVFLNACQIGSGEEILGDYAGMAAAFLRVGAAAVVAPLWSIDDRLARDIANSFYQETLGQGSLPAEVLMRARRAITAPQTKSGAHLAYQFFGHPLMSLSMAAVPKGGRAG